MYILTDEVTERIAGLTSSPSSMPDTEFDGLLSQLSNAELAQLMVMAAKRLSI